MRPTPTHDEAITARVWHMKFTSYPRSVTLARRLAHKTLTAWGYGDEVAGVAALITSELATNAVKHAHVAGVFFDVTVTTEANVVRVEVADTLERQPHAVAAGPEDECGRGLQLVAELADAYGWVPRAPTGKTVWARITAAPLALPTSDEKGPHPRPGPRAG